MLEGFDFGTPSIASQLTGKLATLKRYNGLSIPPAYFMEAMERLRTRFLNVPLISVQHPAPVPAPQAATEQKVAAEAAPVVQEEELTAQQWFERGFAASDPDEGIRFYTEAIRLKPDLAIAFNNRGEALSDCLELSRTGYGKGRKTVGLFFVFPTTPAATVGIF